MSSRAGGTGSQRGVAWGRLVGNAPERGRDARDEPLLSPGQPWDVPSPRLAAVAGGLWLLASSQCSLAPGWVPAPLNFLGQSMCGRTEPGAARSQPNAPVLLKKELWSFSYGICRVLIRRSTCRGRTGQPCGALRALGMGTASPRNITAGAKQVGAGAGDMLDSRAASPVRGVLLKRYPEIFSHRQ